MSEESYYQFVDRLTRPHIERHTRLIDALVRELDELRKDKNFAGSDGIRAVLGEHGIVVQTRKDQPARWHYTA